MGIITYIALPRLKKASISRRTAILLKDYFLWYGLFAVLMFISKRWAFSVNPDSKTMLTVFRILVIGIVLLLYADTERKAYKLLLSYLFGCVILGLAFVITTVLTGGSLGTTSAGLVIGQHRNQVGAVAAPAAFLCFHLYKSYSLRCGRGLMAFFGILTLLTGSRSSILQLALIYAFIALFTERGVSKTAKRALGFFLAMVFALVIVYTVPFLRTIIWDRAVNALLTVTGSQIADRSAQGREAYKTVAFMMFLNRPWLGYGLDGFTNYLRAYPMIAGWHMNAVQAHCNYAEIAADFGVVGLLIWYVPIVKWLRKVIRGRKISDWCGCLFGVITTMILFDYSRIPWDTHLVMYLFIIMMIMTFYAFSDAADKTNHNR